MENPRPYSGLGFPFFITAVDGRGRYFRPPLGEHWVGIRLPAAAAPPFRGLLNIALRFSRSARA
jgi:hypothetical protein